MLLLLVFLILLTGAYLASSKVKTKGFNGLWDFASTVSNNYFHGRKANPEKISIEIKQNDFKKLEKNREQAIERGVIINDIDGEYVPAELEYNGKKIKVRLRLKGHMTDHLQDNKWSFRIKMKDNESLMGMKRFSIQHPGTRGYIYEWIYHELMKREDVIALRYKFINVSVNGQDWGVYALEENFENELIANNNRKKGPILRFNPDLYWVNRYNEYTRQYSYDEFASYYSANPEAYREAGVLKDSIQKGFYMKAIGMFEGLRSKKITVSQAFDITRLAKFHAIIDLVGGLHSIDWSDIKYYFNPVTNKLEPVAYESFTNLSANTISGQYKYAVIDSIDNYQDWHTMIFSDRVFYAEYIKQLERISDTKYLDAFFNDSNKELYDNLSIIYKEFPYKKFDKNLYYKRQQIIKKILSPPKALHAYLRETDTNVITLQVAAIDALPVQINAIRVNKLRSANEAFILPSKLPNEFLDFTEFKFRMPENFKWNSKLIDSVIVEYSVLGSSEQKETKVFPYPHPDSKYIANLLKDQKGTFQNFPFLAVNETEKTILIKSGNYVIDQNLIIPAGYRFIVEAGTKLDIIKSAGITSYSPCNFMGREDEQIFILSSDSTSQGLYFISVSETVFKYVVFKNLPKITNNLSADKAGITFYESNLRFANCSLYRSGTDDAVKLIRSKFLFKECIFKDMNNDAIDADYSEGEVLNCAFENCNGNALDFTMSKVRLSKVYVTDIDHTAFNIKSGSQIKGNDIKMKEVHIGIVASNNSSIELNTVSIENANIGIVAFRDKSDGFNSKVLINILKLESVKRSFLKEKESKITIDGINVSEEVKDIDRILKSENKKDN